MMIFISFLIPCLRSFIVPDSWQPQLLRNTDSVIFTINAVNSLQTVIDAETYTNFILENGLANGFSPGPNLGVPLDVFQVLADFQPKGLKQTTFYSCSGKESLTTPQLLDKAKMNYAHQHGEWGAWQNCSQSESPCSRGIYGLLRCCNKWPSPVNDSEKYSHYEHSEEKTRLYGYPPYRPKTRKEAHDFGKAIFQNLASNAEHFGGVISYNGYSHLEAYASRWGAVCSGVEIGENILDTQAKIMISRGAARSTGVPYCVDASPWLGPGIPGSNHINDGHSHSFLYRIWTYSWFTGAAQVNAEGSILYFHTAFPMTSPWPRNLNVTSVGKRAAELLNIYTTHDRGTTYTPVGLIMDYYIGYGGHIRCPWTTQQWCYFNATEEEFQIYEFFETQLLDLQHAYPKNATYLESEKELIQLRSTPHGDMVDALLSDVNATVLGKYPVLVLAGNIDFQGFGFLDELVKAVEDSNNLEQIVIPPHLLKLLPPGALKRLNDTGIVQQSEHWVNPQTKRESFISSKQLTEIQEKYMPFEVTASPHAVQFSINKNSNGWVVYVANNQGYTKMARGPPVVDPNGSTIVTISVNPGVIADAKQVREWVTNQTLASIPFTHTLKPGEFALFEIITDDAL